MQFLRKDQYDSWRQLKRSYENNITMPLDDDLKPLGLVIVHLSDNDLTELASNKFIEVNLGNTVIAIKHTTLVEP